MITFYLPLISSADYWYLVINLPGKGDYLKVYEFWIIIVDVGVKFLV